MRDRGWRVLAGVRREGSAPEGTEEVLVDVTDPPALELDELHGLVNNAGVAVAGPLEFLPAGRASPPARGERRRPVADDAALPAGVARGRAAAS